MAESVTTRGRTVYGKEILESFADPDATLVVVPGTDDRGGFDLRRWLGAEFCETFRQVIVIDHPAEIRGLVRAKPSDDGMSQYDDDPKWYSFDESSDIATQRTVSTVELIEGAVVLVGYSMGAYALYRAVAKLARRGNKPAQSMRALLWAHPQQVTGMKQGLKRFHPLVSRFFRRYGDVRIDGAVAVRAQGDIEVTSLSVMGDPVTSYECWYRNPIGWLINGLLGFFEVHAGAFGHGAARVHTLEMLDRWRDSATGIDQIVLAEAHPLRLLEETLFAKSGIWLRAMVRLWHVCVPQRDILYEVVAPRTVPGRAYARFSDVRGNAARVWTLAPVVQFPVGEDQTPDEPLAPAS